MADRGAYEYVPAGSPPDVPNPTTPSNHAGNIPTTFEFGWDPSTPSAADSYMFQLSTNSGFSPNFVDTTGLSAVTISVSDMDYLTTYYWQVAASSSFGTSSWSATMDFQSIIESPAVPVLSSPTNDAVNVPVDTNLVWQSSARAETYNVQLATDGDFASLVVNTTGLSGATLSVTSLNNAIPYYWRVSATNVGGTSSWASSWTFTTIIEAPETPLPTDPADGATNQSTSITFDWTDAARANTYNFQLSTHSGFGVLVEDQALAVTTTVVSGLDYSTVYYWRVGGENVGGTSSWADVQDFETIIEGPGLFALNTPSAGETVSITPRFSWASSARAEHYHIQIAEDATFTTGVILIDNVVEQFTAASLPYSATRYWRAQAYNIGGSGTWTVGRTFYTENTPEPTVLPVTQHKSYDLVNNHEIESGDTAEIYKGFVNRDLDGIDTDAMAFVLVTVSGNYSVVPTDEMIMIVSNGGTITLPAAASVSLGQYFYIGNNSTVSAVIDAADMNINGAATIALASGYKMKRAIKMLTEYLVY